MLVHCKKELAGFPSPAGMSLIKLFLGGNNLVFAFFAVYSGIDSYTLIHIFKPIHTKIR